MRFQPICKVILKENLLYIVLGTDGKDSHRIAHPYHFYDVKGQNRNSLCQEVLLEAIEIVGKGNALFLALHKCLQLVGDRNFTV